MPGRKKAKGRGRQNQSRNKSHNQVVRQPSKGQSNDQHSDTDSQANAVEKEDVSSESASNGQYEDISSQASGPPEVLNQHQLEVKDDDEQEEESQIDDTSNDCSIDQEDSSAGVSYQVTAHDVFEEHQPDENYCDDQPDENYSDDQQEDQDSKSNSLDEQAKFDDTSNENSPLKSMIEQQYIQNIIGEQHLEGSLPLLVRESLFAQIAANSPYKRELEEYSPHRQDKRPIKQLRIEPDCKNHSDGQQEKLHCELKQEEQDEKCQDDQLPLDEQDCNSKHHIQQECQQSCSKDVLLYSDKVKLRQEGMDKQLTIKTHEVSHIGEDEVYSDEKDQKSSNQQDQHYDAKQDEEVKVKSDKEIETRCNEQVMIDHEEEQQVRKIEGHDSMQNIQLSAEQKGDDHAEEDEKLIAQEIEHPEAEQNEPLNSKEDEQLATRPNEELAAELDEKLNAEHDGKQNEQFATKLNEELVVEQGELLDNLIGEADAQLIEKSVSESCEEHDTKHYECPSGKVDDEYYFKVNEGLNSEQKDQVGLQEIYKFDIKVDNEIDAKLMEKQQEELSLVSDNAGHNDEFDVRHSEGLPDEISEQYCIMKAKKLDTEEVEKLGVEHISKLEAKQDEQLDDQENSHPVKEIEQLIAKQIEPLDAKANDKICTRQKEQQFTKQNKQFDINQITHLDGKQSEHCIIEHIEYFNFNLDEVVAAQKGELYSKQIEELDDQQNEQICEKQNDKLEADLDLESDVKENKDLDAKTTGKLSIVLDDAIVCEQLYLEQNEELDVREDKDLILKEREPNVQQSEELIVRPYELLTLKPNVQFSVKQNDELEVKVNKYFDGKKNEVLEYTVSDDVAYLNQQYGEKQNDVDVFANDKLSLKGIEDEDVKVNRGDQIEHYTIEKNEEIHVIADAQPNEDLDTKKVEKLGNTQVQDTDSKQCQGINALYKEEKFKEIVLHETEGKQEQEINCNQDQELDRKLGQELDDKQDQEVYVKHDLELDGKQDQELDGKQDQDDYGIQYQELAGTQDKELGGKHGEEDHGKQNEELDGKQGQDAHGKEDQELDGKNDQEVDSKQDQELDSKHDQELDSKQDQDVNSKQDQELDDEQGQELNGIQNLNLNGMQDQGLDGKQDQELDCKEDPEVNGKQDQESNGNQDLDDEQDQEPAVLHYPEVTVQQKHKVEADQSELCFSKQVDMIASDEGKDCNSKQDKTFGNKQNEEYHNGKVDCQLYDRKQMKCSGMGERTNQQDRDKQECEHKGKFSLQDPVANRLLLSVTKNNDSKTDSNLNKRHTQDYLGIDEPTDTHENQKYIYHQGDIESAENYDDEQHNCSFQQTDHLAFNQSKQYNGELTKARNFKQNEERHDCKVNQFYAGKQDEPTGINEYVNQEQEGKQECEFKEEKPQQEDHMQHALWKSQSYEKSSLTDKQPELNDYHDCKDVQQEEVELADNCYDVQYNLSCFHKRDDQQSDVKEIHHHSSTLVLQNNHSLDKHEFLACGQAEKVGDKYEIKTGKHEEKQELKQDDREGERKSFSKQSNQQNVSKQDQNFRVNQYRGKQQYSSRKGFQGGYNKSWNNQKGYQHEYQQKWDQKYHRGYRNCQNNQRHHHQQQAKPQGTSQSGGLVCGVCEEKYDRRNRMPRNLYCGHTVCTSCAWRLLKHFIIVCPQCRTKTLRVSSADKLTINMPLIAILTEEASTKPIVPVSNNEGPESQPYSTEVGATGGQQFDSSLKHTEKAIVTISNSELMGNQSYCNVNYSTEESHSLSSVRSPHSSRCLEVGVHPTAHCAVCDQWVCDICGRIDHLERKECVLFPLKEALMKMKQDKENMSKAVSESLTVSLKEIRCYSDQLDILLLSMHAALECLGKEQEYLRKALQEGAQMKNNLEEVVSKLPQVKNLREALACFQTVENDYAAAFQWISCKSYRVINNDKVKKTGKELLSITLRSLLTSTAENGVVSQIVACQETPTDKKFSQLTVNGARMHLHSLSGITTLKEARALPLECFMVCLDSKSTLTFLDLFWDGTSQGRVYIRLTGNTARGRQFLSLCTGEKGPTFRNTHFHRVWWKGHAGEHVWGGDYDQGDGSGGATLPSNCSDEDAEAELGCAVPITPGLVAGRYEKKDVSSIFRIYTREAKHCMEEAAFGHVEHGLSVVEKAINHNIIQDVIISDCGVVMDI